MFQTPKRAAITLCVFGLVFLATALDDRAVSALLGPAASPHAAAGANLAFALVWGVLAGFGLSVVFRRID